MSKIGQFLGGGVKAKAVQLGATGAATGAGMGAVAPLEDPSNRSEAIGTSALFGSVGNVVAPVAGKALKGAYNVIKKPFSKNTTSDILAKRLPTGETGEILEKLKKADPNDPVIIPDIAGDPTIGLTKLLSKKNPETGKIIKEALEGRSKGASKRIETSLSKDVSDVDTYFGKLDDLMSARSKIADPLYKKAFAQATTLDVSKNKSFFEKIAPDIAEARKEFRMGKAPAKTDKNKINRDDLLKNAAGSSGIIDEENIIKAVDDYKTAQIQFNKNKPKRLIQYIKETGGISDFQGELKASGINSKTLPGLLRKEGSGGTNIDDVGLRLQEAGFFDKRPTTSEVLDMIERDIRTKKVFVPSENQQLYDDAALYIDQFDSLGIDIESVALLKTNKKQFSTKELNEGKISNNSLVMLDATKRILDDKIAEAIRAGKKNKTKVLVGIKKELTDKLDELNPDYKKARQVFADKSSIIDAQKSGLEFIKKRPEQIAKELKNMTQGEKDAYRIGVREKLSEIINKTSDSTNPVKKIFGKSETRKLIKIAIGNDKKYNDFKAKMMGEVRADKTKSEVLGSLTGIVNKDGEFLGNIANVSAGVLTGGKSSLIHATISSLKNLMVGISEKNAKQLASILTNRDKGIEAMEAILAKEKSSTQRRIITEFIERFSSKTLTAMQTEQ